MAPRNHFNIDQGVILNCYTTPRNHFNIEDYNGLIIQKEWKRVLGLENV